MIRFNPDKLVTKHMQVKMVSGALGGTLTVLDENRSKRTKKEVFTKIKIAHHITRHFSKKYRITKYLKPVLTAVTFYENFVVCLERHPLGNLGKEKTEGLFGEVTWTSDSETNAGKLVNTLTSGKNWYIDGTYIYHMSSSHLASAEVLSEDQKFRQVKVEAIKLCTLGDFPKIEERVCLAFFPNKGDMYLTPPIWKTLTNIGNRQLSARASTRNADVDDMVDDNSVRYVGEKIDETQFDQIDEKLCVNLGFVLKAGRLLSEVFGYDSIEPLGLPDMMIQLRTVNLPTVANEVKQTFDTGLKFTIAIAWLIGLTKRAETLDSFITLRSLLKYLTTKGVYRKGAFKPEHIFKSGQSLENVKLMTIKEAREEVQSLGIDAFLRATRLAREIEKAGGLLSDEPVQVPPGE